MRSSACGSDGHCKLPLSQWAIDMKLLTDLLTTEYGLAAVLVTVLSIAMAIGFRVFFMRKMRESADDSER